MCRNANKKSQNFVLVEKRMAENLLNVSRPLIKQKIIEPVHNKTSKMACAPSEDSDQSGHQPSLIRVLAVCSMGS